jgi:putative acetyltransferase
LEIIVDDLSGREVRELLREHVQSMHLHSPPESVHALDVEGLRGVGVTFWTVWEGGELLGCGALKELDRGHGEIKSMRTAAGHLRKGVARRMVAHILAEARRRGYRRVSLETGSAEAFLPARRLYESCGFAYCGPFDGYVLDPFSVFMTREL